MILEYHDNDYGAQVSGIVNAARRAKAADSKDMRDFYLSVILLWIDYPHEMAAGEL